MKQIYNILAALLLVCVLGLSNQMEVIAGKPSTNARSITTSNIEQNTATITWLNGNGTGRLVVVYTDGLGSTAVDDAINDGTIYTGNSDFSTTGTSVLINNTNGRAVAVYRNTGSTRSVNISGLTAGTKYWIKAYEYKNDGGIDPEYNENGGSNNPVSFTTKGTPKPGKATNLLVGTITDKDAEVSWTHGSNTDGYYMDLMNYTTQQMEWEGVDIGYESDWFIEGLNATSDYGYRLQSYDDDGNVSDYTEFKTFRTLDDNTPPEMMSAIYVSPNEFELFFTEPVSFVGTGIETKFNISFTNKNNQLVSEHLYSITLSNDYTSALCSTMVDLNTIKNGTDVTIDYENGVPTKVEDLAGNPMTSPSEMLLTDWTAPQMAKIERVVWDGDEEVYTTEGATYGTSAETIYFRVTFEELVKLTGDAHFGLDFQDGGEESTEGTIESVEMLDESQSEGLSGFATTYLVSVSTGLDNDCDGYSIFLMEGDEYDENPIRDAYGNILIDKEVITGGANEGFKVDRSPLSDLTNGPKYASDEDFDEHNPRFGTSTSSSKTGYVYNESNLNGNDENDNIYIKSFYDAADCSIDGGKVELYYSIGAPETDVDYTYADNIYLTSFENTNWNQGYVTFEFDITAVINGVINEGKTVHFKVVTYDIGGNKVERNVDFGTKEDYKDFVLYDVLAPDAEHDLYNDYLLTAVNSDNSELNSIVYYNLGHSSLEITIDGLPNEDNTLLENENAETIGKIRLQVRRNDGTWVNASEDATDITSFGEFSNYTFEVTDADLLATLIQETDNFDNTLYVRVVLEDNAGNITYYEASNSLDIDQVRPNPNDIEISGIAIGAGNLDNTGRINLLSTDASREYFNTVAQTDNKTLYFAYGIKGSATDNSLPGGQAYLEYRKTSYYPENIGNPNQDQWNKVYYIDDDQENVKLDIPLSSTAYYELASNTNLYEELHTESPINGDVYEFRLIPIDRAGNETSEVDRMAALPSTYETIVLDNVAPKVVKAYSSDLSQFYPQEFAPCGGIDLDDTDDRYFFNKNTGIVGGANDVIGAYFEFELDPTMNRPGNGASTRIQYFDGEGWSYLGSAGLYSSVNLGTMEDNFGEANYPQEDPTHFRVADWVNRQDVTNLWNNFAGDLDNEDDLRFEVVLNDVAGNTVTIYPTPTAEGDPFEESNAFIFRYDRTVPSVSVEFNNPTGCYNIGDNVQVDLTIGNNNANGNTNLTFVAESTMVNDVMLNTDCNIGQNYYDNCNANNLNGYAYGTTGNLSYTVGENDNSITDEEVIPFSVQVMDIAGNKSTVKTHITQATTAEQTPSIDTRLHKNNYYSSFKPFDINDVETQFLYGPKSGNSIINQNSNYLKIEFAYEIPEHVSNIRVYYQVRNNNDYDYDYDYFDAYDDADYTDYFTIPAESLVVENDHTYLVISIADLETEYNDFANSTENQELYLGVKFETVACDNDYNINCDIVAYGHLDIDRVAPRIVTYENLMANADDCDGYENFVNNNNVAGYDIDDLAMNYGYNIFTGPVAYKVTSTEYNYVEGGYGYMNFDVLGSEISYTNANTAGYTVLFSEKLYLTNNNYNNYDYPIYANDFLSLNTNQLANDNNLDNGINSSHSFVLLRNNDLYCGNNSPYQSVTFFAENIVGNGDFEMTLDKDIFVDAAGNKLVDSYGDEYIENISLTYGDISLPFTIDNYAPTVSNLKVYSDIDRQNEISSTCLTTNEQNEFFFEFELTELNSLRYSDILPTNYTIDYVNSSVDANTGEVGDNIGLLIGIRSNDINNTLLGVLKTSINNENFTGDNINYELYKVTADFDFEGAIEGLDYKLFGSLTLSDLDENVTFSLGFSSEEQMMIAETLFVNNNYTMDIAGNVNNSVEVETLADFTIDNKAPVLDYLIANSYFDQALSVNQCFTTTGNGESVVVLSVSVNEKEGLCGETPHFLNANNWTVKIGEEELLPADYSVSDDINCINCIESNNDIKPYYIRIDLKNLTGDYTFDNEGTSGEYNYSLEVTDLVGNIAVSENPLYNDKGIVSNNPLYIDNTAPELTNVVGPEGCYTNGDNFTFKVQVQDLSVAEGACLSDYTTKANWTVSLGTGDGEFVFDGEDFSIVNLGEGEFEFNVMIPESTYTANSLEVINVSFADALGNIGEVTSDEGNLVKIVAQTYEINLTSNDAVVCQDEETFVLEYTTNFEPTTSSVKVGTTTLVEDEDYTLNTENQTITINVDAVNDGDKITLTLGSDCDDVTSDELEVTVNPTPEAPVIIENDADEIVCTNESITFTADEDNNTGYTYSWEIKVGSGSWEELDNVLGDGHYVAEENTLTISNHANIIVNDANTNYTVRATKTNSLTLCDEISVYDGAIIVKAPVSVTSITKTTADPAPPATKAYHRNTNGNKFKVNTINGGNNLTYSWTVVGTTASDLKWTMSNTNTSEVSINFAIDAKPGTLRVTIKDECDIEIHHDYEVEMLYVGSSSLRFTSIGTKTFTVSWTNGTADGKIVVGVQGSATSGLIDKTLNSTLSDELNTNFNNNTTIAASGNWTISNPSNTYNSTFLRSSVGGAVDYKFLQNISNNTTSTFNVSNLTSKVQYTIRLFDYLLDNSGNRIYGKSTQSTQRTSKEGSEADSEDFVTSVNSISTISPNPAKDEINFKLDMAEAGNVTIEIFTAEGRKVMTFTEEQYLNAGENLFNIPLKDFAAGSYMIIFNFGDSFIYDNFIVMP